MADREWKASGAATATTAFEPAAVSAESMRAAGEHNGQTRSWEEVYRTASSAQRRELLALAAQQGLLYARQFPPANGHKPHDDSETMASLTRLLEGRAELPPFAPQALPVCDDRLDRVQREAVARALGTPDFCLIAGPAGTGKSCTVTELLTQAAMRGWRILFLARRAAALDLVLSQLAERSAVLPLRCLEAGEKPEGLPAVVRGLTFAEHVRRLQAALPRAVESRHQTEERCRLRRQEQSLWPMFQEIAAAAQKLEEEREQVKQQQSAVTAEVVEESKLGAAAHPHSGECGYEVRARAFIASVMDERTHHEKALAELDATIAATSQSKAENEAHLRQAEEEANRLRPLADAKRQGRIWSLRWWRAIFMGNVEAKLSECKAQMAERRTARAAGTDELAALEQKRRQLEEEHHATVERLRVEEARQREEYWAARDAELARDWQTLQEKWNVLAARLEPAACRPTQLTAAALEHARVRWQEQVHADEESCRFAREWAAYMQEAIDALPQRLPGLINLVAATPAGLAADKYFSRGSADFDLLVVDEAEQINEAEFLKLARRARRWVLVGNPGAEKPPPSKLPHRNGRVHGIPSRHKLDALAASGAGPVPLFQRLWRSYRCELPETPHSWVREGDRLSCRLKAVDAQQRKSLECERVADFPDIELRILSLPRAVPTLVEVVFPPAMSLTEAKEYIYRELQELPLALAAGTVCLLEDADRFVLHCTAAAGRSVHAVLDKGLRERLGADEGDEVGWRTSALEFDKSAGWSRAGVESWLTQYCRLRDSGRTILLQTSYGAPRVPAMKAVPGLRGSSHLYAGS